MEDRKFELKQAVLTKDVSALLQVYAEGVDFLDPLPDIVSQQRNGHVTSSTTTRDVKAATWRHRRLFLSFTEVKALVLYIARNLK